MRVWKRQLDVLEDQHEQLTHGAGVRTAKAITCMSSLSMVTAAEDGQGDPDLLNQSSCHNPFKQSMQAAGRGRAQRNLDQLTEILKGVSVILAMASSTVCLPCHVRQPGFSTSIM